MVLIGQYDSPFVRRVAIALQVYGMAYEHRPWSTFADAEQLASVNPLRRVPALLLDDAEAVIDSAAILDYLDELVGPGRALIARGGIERRRALRVCALATGLADKAVSLLYERVLHERSTDAWRDRCRTQIEAVLDVLESERVAARASRWFGEQLGHADIAVACALRFTNEAHPELGILGVRSALAAHAAAAEARDEFARCVQVLAPPAG